MEEIQGGQAVRAEQERISRLPGCEPCADFDMTESVKGDGTRMASLFRVQNSLITEWLDVVVDARGAAPAANPGSACQAGNAAQPN